jgi:putative membrane protein
MGLMLLLLIAAAVYLIHKNSESKKYWVAGDNPMEIAKKRYARGEITHEEFEQMKKDLQ